MVLNYYYRDFSFYYFYSLKNKFCFFFKTSSFVLPTAGAVYNSMFYLVYIVLSERGPPGETSVTSWPSVTHQDSSPYTCNPRSSRAHSWLTGTPDSWQGKKKIWIWKWFNLASLSLSLSAMYLVYSRVLTIIIRGALPSSFHPSSSSLNTPVLHRRCTQREGEQLVVSRWLSTREYNNNDG